MPAPNSSKTDSASSLPSPPGAKTPSSSNAVHPFFTPRRILNGIGSNARSACAHLLSPEESPSQRCSKRVRLSRDESPSPTQNLERGAESKLEAEMEEEEPKAAPREMPPSLQYHLFMKSMDGFYNPALGRTSFYPGNWATQPLNFYSRPVDELPISSNEDQCLPFSTAACNRSSLVAIGDEMGRVRLVETAKDEKPGFIKEFLSFQCHENAIFDMSWSPDDLQLATASGDQLCRVFDVTKQTQLYQLKQHQNSVKQIAYNPHNPFMLASSARDGTLNIWDLRVAGTKISEGRDVVTVLQPVECIRGVHTTAGRKPKVNSVTAAVWMNEHRVATTCEHDAQIKVWDLRSRVFRKKNPQAVESSALPPNQYRDYGISSLTISPDGQRMYAVCKDSNVYAYAPRHLSKGPIHAYSHPRLHAETFYVKCDISRDGKFLATGSSDQVGVVFPTEERYFNPRVSANFRYKDGEHALASTLKVGKGVALVRGHDREVTDVAWTMNHDLVTVSDGCQARCWRQDGNGFEAEDMRDGGETNGRRWGWGWAQRN
ncbi:WD40-repeat-containing domain protein [Tricharina praecox]|uniref:WD40-repeat-containing domain protein n=1 Tax=Tricharina praecox TaxID=43433 RepID=UPI002220347B|nr:WD40-repeat-containing domain protein [Tricharina praecox]KAI5843685.1 WD40-repeat-containing domain protein [Tricharina praecox]